jgi:hypothetical protein
MHVKTKLASQQQSQQVETNSWKPKQIAVIAVLIASVLSGAALAQSENRGPFDVQNQKNKKFPATEAARIYEAVCVVVAREVRPEHPPLLQPRFTLVIGADKDELVQENQVAKVNLTSWDREKFAQAVVVLAAREILKINSVPTLSRRALAWTDAVVPLADLADAR